MPWWLQLIDVVMLFVSVAKWFYIKEKNNVLNMFVYNDE